MTYADARQTNTGCTHSTPGAKRCGCAGTVSRTVRERPHSATYTGRRNYIGCRREEAEQMIYEPKPCLICGKVFTPKRRSDILCGDPVCKYKRHRQKVEQYQPTYNAARRKEREEARMTSVAEGKGVANDRLGKG